MTLFPYHKVCQNIIHDIFAGFGGLTSIIIEVVYDITSEACQYDKLLPPFRHLLRSYFVSNREGASSGRRSGFD